MYIICSMYCNVCRWLFSRSFKPFPIKVDSSQKKNALLVIVTSLSSNNYNAEAHWN